MALYYLNQYISKTLDTTGGIDASQTADIQLSDVTDLDVANPGIAIISYADPLDTASAEWITYTSINAGTKKFVGVTRGQEDYAAKAHAKGVTIAFPISKSHINNVNDILNGTANSGGDFSLPTGGNVQVNLADPYRTIVLPAGSMSPTTTAGCASVATGESATNKVCYKYLAFDKDTDEKAFVGFTMPASWDGGVINFKLRWEPADAAGAAETINFTLGGRSYGDDEEIDQAIGTTVAVSDTYLADADFHITDWSGDVTLAGTPAGGEGIYLELMRDVSADDLAGDAYVVDLIIRYKVAQFSD